MPPFLEVIMKNLGYYNGKYDEVENMYIPMGDRVCYFGDGVYDATYSRNFVIHDLGSHIDRLFDSAEMLSIVPPCSKEELSAILHDMVKLMDTGNNFVYFQITRGTNAQRSHAFGSEQTKSNLWINIRPEEIDDTYSKVKLITLPDTRFLHCNIKTLNLLPAVMATEKARAAGCFEAVFHRDGRVTECAHSNIHILKDGHFITAPLDNLILPGVTRRHLIELCENSGIPVEERPFSVNEMMEADEVLISAVGTFAISASEIDGKHVGGKAPKLLKKLQDGLLNEFISSTEK